MADVKEVAFRLLLAFLLGFFIGLERERRHKPAGVRTHTLVALGAALFTLTGSYGLWPGEAAAFPPSDPTRLAAQVVTGVGFIGGGIIFKDHDHIRGLTTAASIWVTAALGTSIAAGLYLPALLGAALGYLTLRLHFLLHRLGIGEAGEE